MDYLFQDGGKPKAKKSKTGTKAKSKTSTKTATKSKTSTKTGSKKGGNFLGAVGDLVAPTGWGSFATAVGLVGIEQATAALRRGKNSVKKEGIRGGALGNGEPGPYYPRNTSADDIEKLRGQINLEKDLKPTRENENKRLQKNYENIIKAQKLENKLRRESIIKYKEMREQEIQREEADRLITDRNKNFIKEYLEYKQNPKYIKNNNEDKRHIVELHRGLSGKKYFGKNLDIIYNSLTTMKNTLPLISDSNISII